VGLSVGRRLLLERPTEGCEARAVLAMAVGIVLDAVAAVPATVQIDEDVVDDPGRFAVAVELVQFEAVVFRPEVIVVLHLRERVRTRRRRTDRR
jgi:hypothetical protein